jgi:hypothetical protein
MRDGTFAEAATPYGVDSLRDGRGLAISDFDGDGGLDFIVNNYNAPPHYYVNRIPNRGHWLRIRLRGRESNRDGIGAVVRARTGDLRQTRVVTAGDGYGSQFSRVAHLGLGDATFVDDLEITWPSNKKQTFKNLACDKFIEIDENGDEPTEIRGRVASQGKK